MPAQPKRRAGFFNRKSMANLEIEGVLTGKLAPQSGRSARGEWAKQEFLLEIKDGNFPATAVFSVWGQDKVNDLAKFNAGDRVKVSFGISSREYNGRWYTDLRAWRIVPEAPAQAPAYGPAPSGPAAGSAPAYGSAGPVSAPAPTMDDMPAEDDNDDLPF